MALTKVLISVKTYPTLSEKYDELVCTAGFLEDGSWIRIYPMPYRKLDYTERYKKWQWIEMDLVRNTKDFRKESYRPADIDKEIVMGTVIDSHYDKHFWNIRKKYVLKHVYYNMDELISEAKNKSISTSLAVLKPAKILDFIYEPTEREWDKTKLDTVVANLSMPNLFEEKKAASKIFRVSKKVPYKFSYIFTTEDGKERKIMIEDWELGMLYWNCLEKYGHDENIACEKVRHKYFDDFAKTKDLYFFMGTTLKFHNLGTNPFIIIGTFTPPKDIYSGLKSLFD